MLYHRVAARRSPVAPPRSRDRALPDGGDLDGTNIGKSFDD
ncbi:MAG: hypothetical protein AAGC60_28760 [Acidobacteriota bacterium]